MLLCFMMILVAICNLQGITVHLLSFDKIAPLLLMKMYEQSLYVSHHFLQQAIETAVLHVFIFTFYPLSLAMALVFVSTAKLKTWNAQLARCYFV